MRIILITNTIIVDIITTNKYNKSVLELKNDELDQSEEAEMLGMPHILPDWSDGHATDFTIGQQ